MAVGISSYLANKLLDHATGRASFTMPASVHAKFHTGDPGAAGTANPSAVTTRQTVTFAAASAGSIAMNNTPEMTLTGTETISHVSFWDHATAGNCGIRRRPHPRVAALGTSSASRPSR